MKTLGMALGMPTSSGVLEPVRTFPDLIVGILTDSWLSRKLRSYRECVQMRVIDANIYGVLFVCWVLF